ncbi:MAG: hypothetical protein QXU98_11320 [Candidatus Parvarchaeota archaeon]
MDSLSKELNEKSLQASTTVAKTALGDKNMGLIDRSISSINKTFQTIFSNIGKIFGGKIMVETKTEKFEEGTVGGGGRKGLLTGGVLGILGIATSILGFVMTLQPIQTVLQGIGKVSTLFVMPLALMLMMMLIPVMVAMAQLVQKIPFQRFIDIGETAGKYIADIINWFEKAFPYFELLAKILFYMTPIVDIVLLVKILAQMGVFSKIAEDIKTAISTGIAGIMAIIQVFVKIITDIRTGITDLVNGIVNVENIINSGVAKLIAVIQVFIKIITDIRTGITDLFNIITDVKTVINDGFVGIKNIMQTFVTIITDVKTGITDLINIITVIENTLSDVGKGIASFGNTIESSLSSAFQNIFSGKFQAGGVVPHTGLALVHKGETIIPAGGSNNNMAITMNINVNSNIDSKTAAQNIVKALQQEIRRNRNW